MVYKRETNVSEMYLVIELQIGYFISLNGRRQSPSPKIPAALEKVRALGTGHRTEVQSRFFPPDITINNFCRSKLKILIH